ncbi:acyl-homoserine-lactone synthase [Palleronia caenipelagi]|uniref:Acyl-homoserine-lactone synthase n=1 Tax=Palleronia caenipelagi TaxID=2489174 RepID=A0A547PUH6_9RHOB|nr:acyl-homoserine-lactone synthase [Palleronia caenipelagi]TRD17795.1 GNAT family N-acetyltransferase [Palleronia caenipelagi]
MIQVIDCNQTHVNLDDLSDFFRFRHRVFRERLGWEMPSLSHDDGEEVDQFDTDTAVYMLHRDESGEVVAGLRLLPTDRPYLLGDCFGDMIDGTAPRHSRVYEVTRLAVDPDAARKKSTSAYLKVLIWGLMQWGLEHGVAGYVSLSYLGMERLLRHSGCRFQRLSAVQPIAGRKSVALQFEIASDIRDCCQGQIDPDLAADLSLASVTSETSVPVMSAGTTSAHDTLLKTHARSKAPFKDIGLAAIAQIGAAGAATNSRFQHLQAH